jgi:hypothetical protein
MTPLPYPKPQAALAVNLAALAYEQPSVIKLAYPLAIIIDRPPDFAFVVKIEGIIHVATRGTANKAQLLSDLNFPRENCEFAEGAVHSGMLAGHRNLFADKLAAVKSMGSADAVLFEGHSRGATIAILDAAAFFGKNGRDIAAVYPFAPCRPGDAKFRDFYDARLQARTFNFVHSADIVPRETPYILGNRHVGTEIWFDVLGVPHVEAPLWAKALSDLADIYAAWRHGKLALLDDHHVSTYVKLLT